MTVTTPAAATFGTVQEAVLAALSPAARGGTGPLARLMREGGLHCVFQPLADLVEGHVYAHEALIRGPEGTPLHTPDRLLQTALQEGLLQDFELLCVAVALQQWGDLGARGRLLPRPRTSTAADTNQSRARLIAAISFRSGRTCRRGTWRRGTT